MGAAMSALIPADLAPAIRAEHEAAQTSARQAVAHAIRAGELLAQAKTQLPHGEFGPWLAANSPFRIEPRAATCAWRDSTRDSGNALPI